MSAVVSDLINGATGVVGSLLNYEMQDRINDENIDNQWQMFHANQRFQKQQNLDMYSTLRRSLEGAGLNVNANFGGYPNTSAPSSTLASKTAPQIDSVGIANLLQQAPLVRSQAEKTQEEAEALRIENSRKRSEDIQYGVEDVMDYVKNHPESPLPDIEVPPKNAGWFKAHREFNQFKGEQHQVNIVSIEDSIKNAQWAKKSVRDALVDMPYRQLKHVIELTKQVVADTAVSSEQKELIKAQTAVIQLQEKLQQDNNIMPYIDKMFSGDFDFKDACKLLVLAVIGGMSRVSLHN